MSRQSQPPKYTGRYLYRKIDTVTGEVIECGAFDEIVAPLPTSPKRQHNNFAILYLMEFYDLITTLGNKKMKVVKYIIENIGYDNMLVKTNADIARATGISLRTVEEATRLLEKGNLITRKKGIIMLNPHLLNRKNIAGEQNIMVKYRSIMQDKEQTSCQSATKAEK